MYRTRSLIGVAIIGILVREALAPFTGHPFDLELWIRLGYYVSQGHDPYVVTMPVPSLSFPGAGLMTWLGYPSTWAFFQAGLYSFYSLIGLNNRFLYYSLLKQPMIIADIAAGYLIFKVVGAQSKTQYAFRSFAFWMLCPYTIIISSVWGMFDQIILVLVLASVLLISETKKSALLEAFGFILKVIPLIYFLVLAFAQKTKAKIAAYLGLSIGASTFLSLAPYLFFRSWNVYSLLGVGADVAHKVGNSLNYWVIVNVYTQSSSLPSWAQGVIQVLSYVWVPAILTASYFCIRFIRRSEYSRRAILTSLLFLTTVFFLTKSVINEQYLIYFLGLGIVDYYASGSAKRKTIFHAIWITATAFLIVNNDLLIRFLDPLSTYYRNLSHMLEVSFAGEIRSDFLMLIAVLFSAFCFVYARSLYSDLTSTNHPMPLNSLQQPESSSIGNCSMGNN